MKTILLTAILFILSAAPAMAQSTGQKLDELYRDFDAYVEGRKQERRDQRRLVIEAEQLREMRRQTRALEGRRWDTERRNRGRRYR